MIKLKDWRKSRECFGRKFRHQFSLYEILFGCDRYVICYTRARTYACATFAHDIYALHVYVVVIFYDGLACDWSVHAQYIFSPHPSRLSCRFL